MGIFFTCTKCDIAEPCLGGPRAIYYLICQSFREEVDPNFEIRGTLKRWGQYA